MPFGVTRPVRLNMDAEGKARLKKKANAKAERKRKTKAAVEITGDSLVEFYEENADHLREDSPQLIATLNELARLLMHISPGDLETSTAKQTFYKISGLATHDDYRIRTLLLQILRMLAVAPQLLGDFLENAIDIVLIRSLDMKTNTTNERLEALKLVGQMLLLYEERENKSIISPFPANVLNCLSALVIEQLPLLTDEDGGGVDKPSDSTGNTS
jgi:hypothetical protein